MTWAVQEFMRQDAAPLEGVFPEWLWRWRLTPTKLELIKERPPTSEKAAEAWRGTLAGARAVRRKRAAARSVQP